MLHPPHQRSKASERPYTVADLEGKLRPELVEMAARQLEKWPFHGSRRLNASKTTVQRLQEVLLNPTYGFTMKIEPDEKLDEESPLSELSQSEDDADAWSPPSLAGGLLAPHLQPSQEVVVAPLPGDSANQRKPGLEDQMSEGAEPSMKAAASNVGMEAQFVRIFLEDRRNPSDSLKSTTVVKLQPVNCPDCPAGQWGINAKELLQKLQQTNSAIEGIVKLSYADPDAPGYVQYFVRLGSGQSLEDASPQPGVLMVPASNILTLFVEHHKPSGIAKCPRSPLLEIQEQTSASKRGRSSSVEIVSRMPSDGEAQPPSKRRDKVSVKAERTALVPNSEDTQRVVEWLISQAEEMPSYQDFKANQNRVQSYVDVVRSWTFAVEFVERFTTGRHRIVQVPISSKIQKVKKREIYSALGVCASWMTEAKAAVRIIKVYGDSGSHPAQEVVEMLAQTKEKGAKGLFLFLEKWQKDHPVAGSSKL